MRFGALQLIRPVPKKFIAAISNGLLLIGVETFWWSSNFGQRVRFFLCQFTLESFG